MWSYISLRSKERTQRNSQTYDSVDENCSNYYYSNGLVYNTNIIQKPSTFLNKVSPKKKKGSGIRKSLPFHFSCSRRANGHFPELSPLTSSVNNNLDRRSKFAKKHKNLISLDETSLNLYRQEHKLNKHQQEFNQSSRHTSVKSASDDFKMKTVVTQKHRQVKLTTLHSNFISLHSDDSVTKNWLKPNLGYVKEKLDSGESKIRNSVILREINPDSTIKRFMFINSRRNALISSQLQSSSRKIKFSFCKLL